MTKETVFKLTLDAELRDAFVAEADAGDEVPADIVRALIRDYVERRRDERAYRDFLARKVAMASASIDAGQGRSNAEVETRFAALRASVDRA